MGQQKRQWQHGVAVFLAVFLVLLLIYFGLQVVEEGTTRVFGLDNPRKALLITREEGSLVVFFAGDTYYLSKEHIFSLLQEVTSFFPIIRVIHFLSQG